MWHARRIQRQAQTLLFIAICFYWVFALVRVSIVVKRHHDYGNSCKVKHLTGAGLWLQGCGPLSHGGTWHAGTRGAGEGAESSTSCSADNRKWTQCHHLCSLKHRRPQSQLPQWHSLQQGDSKATPPHSATPYEGHFLLTLQCLNTAGFNLKK